MKPQAVHVGMAELAALRHPALLVTLGLGSCIGLVLYDEGSRIAGLVHIMLPDSRQSKSETKPGKFADTALPALLDELSKLGATRSRLKAKMAGGAQMFNLPGSGQGLLAVGNRNIEATTALLAKLKIPLVASDTGGNKGRSIEFSTDNWVLTVKTLGKGVQML
ncbi:MAG: chemotaxis protein CheD [Synergistaceae bacterium]|jgi:chemotaxis protein CheD|nr:chemotaxis protein CheD [Synergistaceae bacterium]